eukprot:gene5167-2401_t
MWNSSATSVRGFSYEWVREVGEWVRTDRASHKSPANAKKNKSPAVRSKSPVSSPVNVRNKSPAKLRTKSPVPSPVIAKGVSPAKTRTKSPVPKTRTKNPASCPTNVISRQARPQSQTQPSRKVNQNKSPQASDARKYLLEDNHQKKTPQLRIVMAVASGGPGHGASMSEDVDAWRRGTTRTSPLMGMVLNKNNTPTAITKSVSLSYGYPFFESNYDKLLYSVVVQNSPSSARTPASARKTKDTSPMEDKQRSRGSNDYGFDLSSDSDEDVHVG